MCTSVILFRKEHHWPLIVGSNRDESFLRKSKFPARHWPKTYPKIIGGFDEKKGGSWFAINDYGLISIIHNRNLEKNNNLIKKSRGNIILELLDFENIDDSLEFLKNLNQSIYNGFNIILANKDHCYWGKHISVEKKIEIAEINEGISILTNKNLNDLKDRKTHFYLNKFSQAPIPNPSTNNWLAWELLLATEKIEDQNRTEEAICFFDKENNYGTRSSSLIGISDSFSFKQYKNPIIYLATENAPSKSNFIDVDFGY
tara:strand:+ start:1018 stop:1791 length:774 start_codon:yes stop_codon:yes gene_type:complete